MPAWGDTNLRDIAGQIESPLFLAHVRAATGSAVQQDAARCREVQRKTGEREQQNQTWKYGELDRPEHLDRGQQNKN